MRSISPSSLDDTPSQLAFILSSFHLKSTETRACGNIKPSFEMVVCLHFIVKLVVLARFPSVYGFSFSGANSPATVPDVGLFEDDNTAGR